MATGKATKAGKATKSKATAAAAKSSAVKAKPPAAAKKPAAAPAKGSGAASKASPPAKPAAGKAPARVEPAPAPAPSPDAAARKKKNVKRGAPPMLPRRMVRRPDGTLEGAAPSTSPPRSGNPPSASLHAPARAPEGAESLKQRLSAVMSLVAQLRGLKRTLNRQFYEAGLVLQKLSDPELYKAKGYGSFESFVEREVERELSIGRSVAHDLVQIVRVFQREAAEELGLERLRAALRALWPEPGPATASSATGTGSGG